MPLILEIWNKQDRGEDLIVGIIKINMSSIPKSILMSDLISINSNFLQSNQSQILIVCNEFLPITDFVDQKERGLQLVTIAFGFPLQVSKFENSL